MSYNFENLSPVDFENLGVDLLQKHLNQSLIESFTPGKDGGVDARYVTDKGKTIIIQFKHYKNFQDLKSNLKKELEKIEKIFSSSDKKTKPVNEYILVTSVGLTPGNKQTIRQMIPYLNKDQSIYGRNELNNLLRQYPEVTKTHFKLWLNSTAVLEKIFDKTINKDIYNQSDFEIDDIQKKLKLYVENGNIGRVEKKLKDNNYCIISGVPGVGKTTLAQMLILSYLYREYEIYVISRDIKEAFRIYSPNKKILYYYDDFLGTTFLKEALPKNEDSHLIKFIEKIKNDKNKKIILTTREYILQQALSSYEKIKHSNVLNSKFIIELKQYSSEDKAKILFNHLYFSEINKEYLTDIQVSRKYIKIVKHKNFNPRLIEFMTNKARLRNVTHGQYGDWCISNLDNPEKIWEGAFENISQRAKILCYFIAISDTSGFGWSYKNFRDHFRSFYTKFCQKYNEPLTYRCFL